MQPSQVITTPGMFWELLESDGLVTTKRAKVPGGWLVQQFFVAPQNRDESKLGGMVFINDPSHTWTLKKEFK